jgi:preprotein translocase subunit SecB
MTDETASADTAPSFVLKHQYIKDLSFENPRAPAIYSALSEPPQIEVQVNLNAQRLSPELFELTLAVNIRAISDKITVFMVDLAYAGMFEVKNLPEDHLEQAVMVQGAFLIFPYARRVISDVTRDGGFPALNLEPIDFFALHANKVRKEQATPAA